MDPIVKVVITGGKGFIGRAVAAELQAKGYETATYDRSEGFDVQNPLFAEFLKDREAGAVVHLAGVLGTHELFDEPEHAIDVNVHGTLNVLKACVRNEIQYVGITMPAVFPSIYTATKVAADCLASAFHNAYDLPTAHVRAFNAFGPGQAVGQGHPQKIIPTFASYAWKNKPIPIWGDGSQTVDLISTKQLAKVFARAIDFEDDSVFDGGTGVPFTVLEVAERVLEITGSNAGVEFLPMRRGEVQTQIVATGEGWDKLGFKPEFIDDELVATVESYHP